MSHDKRVPTLFKGIVFPSAGSYPARRSMGIPSCNTKTLTYFFVQFSKYIDGYAVGHRYSVKNASIRAFVVYAFYVFRWEK